MNVIVEIKAEQRYSNHHTEIEENRCEGTMQEQEKGTVIEFVEQQQEEKIAFKLFVMPDKIISFRNEQKMTFDTKKGDAILYQTPYGAFHMQITTNRLEVKKEANRITAICLAYEIEVEGQEKYTNEVNFTIQESKK